MVTLYFIRHGETDVNLAYKNGTSFSETGKDTTNLSLNETGREQAKSAIVFLPEKFDAVFASPLLRTKETAEIICREKGIDPGSIVFRDELVEYNRGKFEGYDFEVASKILGYDSRQRSVECTYDYREYGGAYWKDVYDKVALFLEETKKENDGKVILVVTSAGIIRMTYKILLEKISPTISRSIIQQNASVHEFLL